jgi:hypothetical protein
MLPEVACVIAGWSLPDDPPQDESSNGIASNGSRVMVLEISITIPFACYRGQIQKPI